MSRKPEFEVMRPEEDSYPAWWVVEIYNAACADPTRVSLTLAAFSTANNLGCPCNDTECY